MTASVLGLRGLPTTIILLNGLDELGGVKDITREPVETTNPGSEELTNSRLTAREPARDRPKPALYV